MWQCDRLKKIKDRNGVKSGGEEGNESKGGDKEVRLTEMKTQENGRFCDAFDQMSVTIVEFMDKIIGKGSGEWHDST